MHFTWFATLGMKQAQNPSARLTTNLKSTLTTASQTQRLKNSILPSQWLKCFNMSSKLVKDSLNAHDLEDWLNLDNELPTTEQMSDEQIFATVTGHSNENESSDEEDDGQEEKQVSNSEAAECFKKCLSWMEGQNNVDPVQFMKLRRMMDFAMRSRYKTLKQTSMFIGSHL